MPYHDSAPEECGQGYSSSPELTMYTYRIRSPTRLISLVNEPDMVYPSTYEPLGLFKSLKTSCSHMHRRLMKYTIGYANSAEQLLHPGRPPNLALLS